MGADIDPSIRWRYALPFSNLAMRGASLASRFALSIYVAHMLGYHALGIIGLLAGIAGVAPAAFGFGLSYHVNRQIVGLPHQEGYRLLRDRLAFSCCTAIGIALIVGLLILTGTMPRPPRLLPSGMIIMLEYVAFDLHLGLISLRRPVAANFLLFIRSASWIAPVIALGLLEPRFRSLDLLLGWWIGALLLNFMLLPLLVSDAPFRELARAPVDWPGLLERIRRAPLIYVNDLSATGQVYLDRFIVAHLIGVTATGIYTLSFSVTQGLYVLVATAVTQLSMPKLVAARVSGGLIEWRKTIVAESWRVLAFAVPIVTGALIIALMLLPAIGFDAFARSAPLFALMSLAALIKPFADLANTGLYSLSLDRALARINITGVALSALLGIGCINLFGLMGVGISSILAQLVLVGLRAGRLHCHVRGGQ